MHDSSLMGLNSFCYPNGLGKALWERSHCSQALLGLLAAAAGLREASPGQGSRVRAMSIILALLQRGARVLGGLSGESFATGDISKM